MKPDYETLYDLYVTQGLTTTTIGEQVGVHGATIGDWLKSYGIPRRIAGDYRRGTGFKPDRDTLLDLYVTQHRTTRQIGTLYGVSKTQVRRWLNADGIECRDSGAALAPGLREPTADELYQLIHVEHRTYREVGTLFGTNGTSIMNWVKKHEIARPNVWDSRYKGNRPTLPDREELEALYHSGMSLTDIGILFGVTEGPIRVLCRKFGIQAKPSGWCEGKRFLCQDGHFVRSMYEQRVDEWLFAHNVEHTCEPPLPCDRRYKADFLANGWYIEIWGVTGNAAYKQRCQQKRQLYHQHGYPLIELGVDFFATRRQTHLEKRLQQVLTPHLISMHSDCL